MMNCDIGIEWFIAHHAGIVRWYEAVRYDSNNKSEAHRYPELEVSLPFDVYRREVIAFATEALIPFDNVTKRLTDEHDRRQYDVFWAEYRTLLQKFSGAA